DSACSSAFPDPRAELDALLASLEEAPRSVSARHPSTGEPIEVVLTAEAVATSIRNVLYLTSRASLVPLLIRETARGNAAPLLALGVASANATSETMSLGMTLTVLCSEDLPRIRAEEEEPAVAGTFLGSSALDAWKQICEPWPRADLRDGFHRLQPMDIPALLLSGNADPAVPPVWAERTAELLPESLQVVVPGMGHNVSHVGCLPELIADFLQRVDRGTVSGLDTGCVAEIERPPFVTSFAGPEP
ncbi:MAG: alpha/beta hydrolase, partial [Holophagales bacterium]|nr:alpha/beta hydrolase [Holophagales bacterium]